MSAHPRCNEMQSAPQKEEITGGHKIEISDNIKWQTDRVAP